MLNSFLFIIGTLLYYYVKHEPTKEVHDINPNPYTNLGIYFLLTLIVQYLCNVYAIKQKCGGALADNLGGVFAITIIPWVFIFGLMIVAILSFPGFKSVFADVVGYLYVSSGATKVITELLVNRNINDSLENMDREKKREYEDVSDLILKICGNTGVLINQIVPGNFNQYWEMLQPLMKTRYKGSGSTSFETLELKQQLKTLVATRDNVGEFIWYLYTGILVVSLVQLKLSTKKCSTDLKTMESNYQTFLEAQKETNDKKELAESTTYTL
jgi:hypothetical protein